MRDPDASAARARPWKLLGGVLLGAVFVAYPVLVWYGLTRWSPRDLSIVLLCVLLPLGIVRLRTARPGAAKGLVALPLVTIAALGLAAALDQGGYVLLVPVAVNAVLLVGFGSTLRPGAVPMIERFARLQVSGLSADQQAWCRAWTRIWCAFFVFNGGTSLTLGLLAPLAWWAAYNGLVAYVLMGILFATEWILRRRRFPDLADATDASRDDA